MQRQMDRSVRTRRSEQMQWKLFAADIRDRVFSRLVITPAERKFVVDYRLSPFHLFLEILAAGLSPYPTKKALVAALSLSPEIITCHAQSQERDIAGHWGASLVMNTTNVSELHLQSAASPAAEEQWAMNSSWRGGDHFTFLDPDGRPERAYEQHCRQVCFPRGWAIGGEHHLHTRTSDRRMHFLCGTYPSASADICGIQDFLSQKIDHNLKQMAWVLLPVVWMQRGSLHFGSDPTSTREGAC